MSSLPFEALVEAESELKKAKSEQYIGTFSIARGTTNSMLLRGPLAKTLCQRLAALHYLRTEDIEDVLPEVTRALLAGETHAWVHTFNQAVGLLQEEAQLRVDEWLSEKTFDALQNVFSFEDKTHMEHWLHDGRRRFFYRAVYARLNVLGFVPQPMPSIFTSGESLTQQHSFLQDTVHKCLDYFKRVAVFLGINRDDTPVTSDMLITQLFDMDNLTAHFSNKEGHISARLKNVLQPIEFHIQKDTFPDIDDTDIPGLALRFLMAHARIEVWLNGYGSGVKRGKKKQFFNPDHDITARSYSINLMLGRTMPRSADNIRLSPELARTVSFWDDAHRLINQRTGRERFFAQRKLKTEIFNRRIHFAGIALRTIALAHQLQGYQTLSENNDIGLLNQNVANLDDDSITAPVWKENYSASFLDGAKRALAWLVKKAKRIFSYFVDKLRMLVRAVKSIAIKGLQWFRKLGLVFANATRCIMQMSWFQSDKTRVLRDKDFDITVLIDAQASASDTHKLREALSALTGDFRAASAIAYVAVIAMLRVKLLLINPLIGGVRALLFLANFTSLISNEDRVYIHNAFSRIRVS